jgi:hypothetical protein
VSEASHGWESASNLFTPVAYSGGSLVAANRVIATRAARLAYLRLPRARLKIAPQQLPRRRAGEANPKEAVQRALLNLRPGLPG